MKRGVPLWQNVADYVHFPGLVDWTPSKPDVLIQSNAGVSQDAQLMSTLFTRRKVLTGMGLLGLGLLAGRWTALGGLLLLATVVLYLIYSWLVGASRLRLS